MTAVTCIGLGLMGSALARAALASGHGVAVWNRTPGKAQALADIGALAASTRVLLETNGVAKHLVGRTIVNLTTGTPREAEALSVWVGAQGAHYLDGAILCGPNAIGTENGEVVFSGDVLAWQSLARF